jgi:hypothetical protein
MEIPFLVTTNTEVEAIADVQYLMDHEIMFDVPPGLNAILQVKVMKMMVGALLTTMRMPMTAPLSQV